MKDQQHAVHLFRIGTFNPDQWTLRKREAPGFWKQSSIYLSWVLHSHTLQETELDLKKIINGLLLDTESHLPQGHRLPRYIFTTGREKFRSTRMRGGALQPPAGPHPFTQSKETEVEGRTYRGLLFDSELHFS